MRPEVVKYLLMVVDMDRAVAFYRDALGLTERLITPGWSELACGDAIVALHAGGDGEQRVTGLSLQYADLDAAYGVALDAGASAVRPPEDRPGEPIRLTEVADPEGNVIMLTEMVDQG